MTISTLITLEASGRADGRRTMPAQHQRGHSATAVEDHTVRKAMPGRNRDAGWSHDHPAR
eukprot:1205471-Prymnesium_polylepis.1